MQLLAKIQAHDNRNVDKATIAAWHEVVSDLDFEDAMTAVADHRRQSAEYLLPVHVREGVRRIRGARLAAAGPPMPTCDPDDIEAYQAERKRMIEEIASGRNQPQRIEN